MIRFTFFVVACIALVCGVGYLLTSAVQQSGAAHSAGHRPQPGGVLNLVEANDVPPDPGANLEARLRSLISDRDLKVVEATLPLGESAVTVVQMVRELQSMRVVFDAEMAGYEAAADYASRQASFMGAIGAGELPFPPIPMFPAGQVLSHLTRLRATIDRYRVQKQSTQNQVQMIQNQFLRDFIEIIGQRRASEAPPTPVTPVDHSIEEAERIVGNLDEIVRKVTHGYM